MTTRHRKSVGVLSGLENEEDWFDYVSSIIPNFCGVSQRPAKLCELGAEADWKTFHVDLDPYLAEMLSIDHGQSE